MAEFMSLASRRVDPTEPIKSAKRLGKGKPAAEIPDATGKLILALGFSRCDIAAVPAAPTAPVTPVTAGVFVPLHDLILHEDTHALNEIEKQRFQRHLQKFTKAAQTFIARGVLRQECIKFLLKTNDDVRLRLSTKSLLLGKATVMKYKDLAAARLKRSEKEAIKAMKKARDRGARVESNKWTCKIQCLRRGRSLPAQEQRR